MSNTKKTFWWEVANNKQVKKINFNISVTEKQFE